ncbi:MAG: FAD binding domain-containing protein [Chromatiales bacterium]|nr:FAD binding domain-containing protein [Chromatiales bacterium]
MQLPPFDYAVPRNLAEAVDRLAASAGNAAALAGGTDLLVNLKYRLVAPAALVAIRGLPELRGVRDGAGGGLDIGAGELLADLLEHPRIAALGGLHAAIRAVGSQHIRNLGTLGGNLCLPTRCWYTNQSEAWRTARTPCWKTEGLVCHVIPSSTTCRALNSADTAPMLVALGASLVLRGPRGERALPLADFYQDDGVNQHTLQPGELIVRVLVPAVAGRSAFRKLAARTGLDYGYASVAGVAIGPARRPRELRVVAGSVASRPVRLRHAEALVLERGLTPETIEAAAEATRADLGEVTNLFSPPGYKKRVVRGLVAKLLADLATTKERAA